MKTFHRFRGKKSGTDEFYLILISMLNKVKFKNNVLHINKGCKRDCS